MTPLHPHLHVRRWHSNPAMCHVTDTTAAHSARMIALAMQLWPDDWLSLVKPIMCHDAAEAFLGDPPGGLPDAELKAAYQAATARINAANGWEYVDDERLHLVDKLDAYLMMKRHAPDELQRNGWPEQWDWMRGQAVALGCMDALVDACGG